MSAPIQVRSIQAGNIQAGTLESASGHAGLKAARFLSGLQARDGHWCGELKAADTTLESGYILFQLWLYPPVNGQWTPETRPLIDKAVRSILDATGVQGIDANVQAYCALKLAGLQAGVDGGLATGPAKYDSYMARLRQAILDAGGIQAAGSRLKIHLSLFGLYPAEDCPSIPVELILLPFDFLYQMAAWERTVAVPLSIVQSAVRPANRRPVPAGFNLDELNIGAVTVRSCKTNGKLAVSRNASCSKHVVPKMFRPNVLQLLTVAASMRRPPLSRKKCRGGSQGACPPGGV
jgi:squalene-hopene/tetraprenyl-beta-curcumene cyclase